MFLTGNEILLCNYWENKKWGDCSGIGWAELGSLEKAFSICFVVLATVNFVYFQFMVGNCKKKFEEVNLESSMNMVLFGFESLE